MKIYTFILGFGFLLLVGCSQNEAIANSDVKHVSALEFKQLVESGEGQLVDIRTQGEFNAGHIEGALMIDYYAATFRDHLSKLNPEEAVYIYCRSGNRTSKTVRLLESLEFKEIVNLKYGIIDWNRNGFQLIK